MAVELGTSLAQARLARGLTLEDAERSTRIARKFLIALEEHNYAVFPAPVYARGFLRTYCRYLNLDPEPHLAELPVGWNGVTPTTHLPPVSRPVNLNMTWIIGGIIAVTLIAGIYLYMRSDEGLGDLQTSLQPQQEDGLTVEPAGSTGSSDTATNSTARSLTASTPGVMPDLNAVNVDDAIAYFQDEGLDYLVIDTPSNSVQAGLIMTQTPAAQTTLTGSEVIIVEVSGGSTIPTVARTDCSVLAISNRRTAAEQAYYEGNCGSAAPGSADRTSCAEIRGTDYRSPTERQFFLDNCITG